MTTKRSKRAAIGTLFTHPQTLVARLILAEVLAKHGEGPLRRKRMVHAPGKR